MKPRDNSLCDSFVSLTPGNAQLRQKEICVLHQTKGQSHLPPSFPDLVQQVHHEHEFVSLSSPWCVVTIHRLLDKI